MLKRLRPLLIGIVGLSIFFAGVVYFSTSAAVAVVSSSVAQGTIIGPANVATDVTAPGGQVVNFYKPIKSATGFVHPGIFLDKSQLDLMKQKINANPTAQPWAFVNGLTNTAKGDGGQVYGSLSYVPRPVATIDCTVNNLGCTAVEDDGVAAYTHALKYYYSTEPDRAKYANKSIEIINAWSSTTRATRENSARLVVAFAAGTFAQAAEILRYSYSPQLGQPTLNVSALQTLFTNVFAPTIQAGDPWSNGNWELSMARSMMNMGVFNDDRAMFDRGVELWRQRVPAYIYMESDGARPRPVPGGNYTTTAQFDCFWAGAGTVKTSCPMPANFGYHQGMTQETCRDMGHVGVGLRALTEGAETAYLQGLDLYGEQRERIVAAHEFATKYDTQMTQTGSVPSWLCGGRLVDIGRHTLGWEVAYNHYRNRLGIDMPYSAQFLKTYARTSWFQADQFTAWPTLTHADDAPSGCTNLDRRLGSVTVSLDVPSEGTYRLWTRVRSSEPDAATYALQVDTGCPVRAGTDSLVADEWTWVATQANSQTKKTDFALSAGTHTVTISSLTPGLSVDDLTLINDLTCRPNVAGDACEDVDEPELPPDDPGDPPDPQPVDTTPPTVSLTEPTGQTDLSGSVSLEAEAQDDFAVARVQYFLGEVLIGSAGSAPYAFSWDTTSVPNGQYTLTAKAVDQAGNTTSTDALPITIENVDVQPPTVPQNVSATADSPTSVTVAWSASIDNIAVAGYRVLRDGQLLTTLDGSQLRYTDTSVSGSTPYLYTVQAVDAATNASAMSGGAVATTPKPPDVTAPSATANLKAVLVGGNRLSVSWSAATDNVGVSSYRLSRNGTVLNQSSALSYSDLKPAVNTAHTYAVSAIDAAGNVGPASSVIAPKTAPAAAVYGAGFAGAYFTNNVKLSGLPVERNDASVNFNWGTGAPVSGVTADNFSARWTGLLIAPASGTYAFYSEANDGVRLWVNNTLLIDRWVGPSSSLSAKYSMTAKATYNVRLEYFDTTSSAYAKLLWAGPGIAKAPVPSSVVSSGASGLSAAYYPNAELSGSPAFTRTDATVNFDWGAGTPDSRVSSDNFSVRWTGKVKATNTGTYTFFTDSADGIRLWVNGKQLVDNWTSHGLTTNSGTIALTAGTLYDVRVESQERTGNAVSKLFYSGPGISKVVVPSSALRDR